jgi:hypothetical protein
LAFLQVRDESDDVLAAAVLRHVPPRAVEVVLARARPPPGVEVHDAVFRPVLLDQHPRPQLRRLARAVGAEDVLHQFAVRVLDLDGG